MLKLKMTGFCTFLLFTFCAVTAMAQSGLEERFLDAARNKDIVEVRSLLGQVEDINVTDSYGQTALFYAVRSRYLDLVNILLEAGADADILPTDKIGPLLLAASRGYDEIVEALLFNSKKKPALELFDPQTGSTALIQASYRNYKNIVFALLISDADINFKDFKGNSALLMAAQQGSTDAVRLLLGKYPQYSEYGYETADVNLQNNDGVSPLLRAASKGRTEEVALLLDAGARPNLPSRAGALPIHSARHGNHTAIVELLENAAAK